MEIYKFMYLHLDDITCLSLWSSDDLSLKLLLVKRAPRSEHQTLIEHCLQMDPEVFFTMINMREEGVGNELSLGDR